MIELAEMATAAPFAPAVFGAPALPAPDSVPRMLTDPPMLIVREDAEGTVKVTPTGMTRFPEPETVSPALAVWVETVQVSDNVPELQEIA